MDDEGNNPKSQIPNPNTRLTLWRVLGFGILMLGFIAPGAVADNASLSARVSSTQLAVGQPFTYSVTVEASGGSVPRPSVGPFPDFEQVGTSTSQSISFVNGAMSATVSFVFTLVPRREGKFTIPPATVNLNGQSVSSNAVEVTVSAGSAAPTPSPASGGPVTEQQPAHAGAEVKVGIEVVPSKTRVYLGEPVTLSLNVYGNTALAGYSLEPTPPQGFWMEEVKLPEKPEVEKQQRNGETFYTVLVKRTILFPTTTGRIRIPATRGAVQFYMRRMQRDPLADFFDDPFFNDPFFQNHPAFNRSVVVTDARQVQSNAPEITVLPLPEAGRPNGFTGSVGDFSIRASLAQAEARAGEGVTLAVEITGRGNLKGATAPVLAEIPGVNVFTTNTSATFSADRSSYSGQKRFEYVLVPLSPGTYTVPSVSFAFFDPEAGTYRTVNTDTLSLTVLAGAPSAAGQALASQYLHAGQKEIIDVRPIRPFRAGASWLSRHLLLVNLLPLVALLVAGLMARHRHLLATDKNYGGVVLSRGAARKFLKSAAALLAKGDQEAFYLELMQALSRYIGHRYHVPPPAVQPEAVDALLEHRASTELRQRCRDLLATCHLARYSPSRLDRDRQEADLRACETIIRDLERQR